MDIGLKYEAINQVKIDVMNVFTTDGQLASADIVMLKDDKHLFPSYDCGFVVRDEIITKHPELKDAFSQLAGLITNQDMTAMNNLVESGGKEPEEVAQAFLHEKALVK